LTYRQAADLTRPQLMHALGIEPDLSVLESARIVEIQNEIFDRIRIRRRCFAVELLRIPADDLEKIVASEIRGEVKFESIWTALKRYADGTS
jgi:hypothetical protein